MSDVVKDAVEGGGLGSWAGPVGMGIGAVGNVLAGAFGGGQQYNPGKLHSRWADPYQGQLFQQQMKRAMSGAGDFGFGQAAKQGTSQLQQMMADRGISQGSGVGMAATGNMLANAMGQDIGNRRAWTGQLLNTQPFQQTSDQGWENSYAFDRYGEHRPSTYST